MAKAQSTRTHCPRGHEYNEVNTCFSGGRRHCLQCAKDARAAARPRRPSLLESLLDRTLVTEGCWVWLGALHVAGYGVLGARLAHRLMYETVVGPIPNGLTIDHLCRNRRCVCPWHLEPVSIAENVLRGESLPAKNARKTHCPQGHPYDEANTYFTPSTGHRICRTCNRERQARRPGG